ncbi:MAG: SDR family NAD(P)-dependent oxidoreductase [Ketobacteraceae bacterium]|nr:SDR family NAD(P)-dependent oxidoreductase [Ketobacteraceae bacterium]
MNKTVVITGASSGIGYACAEACLRQGYRVIATARKEQDLDELKRLGAIPVYLELLDEQSVDQAAGKILDYADNRVDCLFNNAGYGLQVAMEDTNWESLEKQHRANVIGPIQLTNRLLPAIPEGGKLVFNGSVLGVITVAFRGPYCMSKYALEAAVDAYRLELESLGIDVHLIQPGPIEAKFRSNALARVKEVLAGRKTRLDYQRHFERLESESNTRGTLPASSVADVFIGILEGSHRKTRYLVTNTAKLSASLKRILGDGFHRIARKAEPAEPL